MNFQVFNLDLENAEEPEIKLPTSVGSSKKQGGSRKTSISALLTMPKPLTVCITINWKILKECNTTRKGGGGRQKTPQNAYLTATSSGEVAQMLTFTTSEQRLDREAGVACLG